jgi:hypothetical protein
VIANDLASDVKPLVLVLINVSARKRFLVINHPQKLPYLETVLLARRRK